MTKVKRINKRLPYSILGYGLLFNMYAEESMYKRSKHHLESLAKIRTNRLLEHRHAAIQLLGTLEKLSIDKQLQKIEHNYDPKWSYKRIALTIPQQIPYKKELALLLDQDHKIQKKLRDQLSQICGEFSRSDLLNRYKEGRNRIWKISENGYKKVHFLLRALANTNKDRNRDYVKIIKPLLLMPHETMTDHMLAECIEELRVLARKLMPNLFLDNPPIIDIEISAENDEEITSLKA